MKKVDKLVNGIKLNKKLFLFLVTLGIVGIIVGSIFAVGLKVDDKMLIKEYLDNYLNNINDNKLNYLEALKNISISNYLFIILIWILGISLIGIPIIIFMYFMKCFMLGFSISAILINYNFKGLLFALLYIFPHLIINILIYIILILYALTLSLKILEAVIKKKNINFKYIMNKYLVIILFSFLVITLTNLFEVYLTPILIKLIIPIIT